MPLLGTLIKKGIKIRESLEQEYSPPYELQKQELRKLMIHASATEFGKAFNFRTILRSFKSRNEREFYKEFTSTIPIYTYNSIYHQWWHKIIEGKSDVCWPGKVKYFALSSGTSEAASKYIPVTKDLTKSIRKGSVRQMLTMSKYDFPAEFFETGILMIGGSTHLDKKDHYFYGDLSGIQAANLPVWFQHFYKPGKSIAKSRDWDEKLHDITVHAKDWDIGIIVGVPAWIQILLERIIKHYGLNNIHELWPNLCAYVHSGVSFDPYKKGFEKLLGRPIHFVENYLASEGFIAFSADPDKSSMRLLLNNGIFFEFVPFNEQNFDVNGDIRANAEGFLVSEVKEGEEYAILLSTCAGAWRYLIGDVIKFVSVEHSEIVITGRTKHFLSLTGEHLSIDNMNKALELMEEELDIQVKEFTVTGMPHGTLFAHKWYIGTDDTIDPKVVIESIDKNLCRLNDDYRVERGAALVEVNAEILPSAVFYNYMEYLGKSGGQHKFPRVLKNKQLDSWKDFLAAKV